MRTPNYEEQKNIRSIDYKGFITNPTNYTKQGEIKKVKLQLNDMPHSRIMNEKDARDANYRGFMNLM